MWPHLYFLKDSKTSTLDSWVTSNGLVIHCHCNKSPTKWITGNPNSSMPGCSLENYPILIDNLSSRCTFSPSTSATHIYLGAYRWHRCAFPSMGLGERGRRGLFRLGVTDLLLKETGPPSYTHTHTHTMPSPSVSRPLSPGLVLLKYPPPHPSEGLCHCKSLCRLKQCQSSDTHTLNVSFSL